MTDTTKIILLAMLWVGVMFGCAKIGGGVGFAVLLLITLLLIALIYAEDCKERASNSKQRKLLNERFKQELREAEKY